MISRSRGLNERLNGIGANYDQVEALLVAKGHLTLQQFEDESKRLGIFKPLSAFSYLVGKGRAYCEEVGGVSMYCASPRPKDED